MKTYNNRFSNSNSAAGASSVPPPGFPSPTADSAGLRPIPRAAAHFAEGRRILLAARPTILNRTARLAIERVIWCCGRLIAVLARLEKSHGQQGN